MVDMGELRLLLLLDSLDSVPHAGSDSYKCAQQLLQGSAPAGVSMVVASRPVNQRLLHGDQWAYSRCVQVKGLPSSEVGEFVRIAASKISMEDQVDAVL